MDTAEKFVFLLYMTYNSTSASLMELIGTIYIYLSCDTKYFLKRKSTTTCQTENLIFIFKNQRYNTVVMTKY